MNTILKKSLKRIFNSTMLLILMSLVCIISGCGFKSNKTQTNNIYVDKQKVVAAAYSQIGKKYQAGGCSPQKGFDCSGLIWWSYKKNGINIPRTTIDQAKTGIAITKSKASEGDIFVFRSRNSPRGLHTGIYCGNDKFIHSPGKGKNVRMDNLSTSYWKNNLIAVRRIGK